MAAPPRAQPARSDAATASASTAGVLAPPPIVFAGAVLLGLAIQRRWPLPLGRRRRRAVRAGGAALIVLGAGTSAAVVRNFRRAGTAVSPLSPTSAVVTSGPYARSRNPDYIGQALLAAGSAAVANAAWPLLLLPAACVLVDRGVVRREERYLRRRFGRDYRVYASRVPRWV